MKTHTSGIPSHILPVIVFAQFAGTSLWFAVNAIVGELQSSLGLPEGSVGDITSAVQFGFIAGTLAFSVLSIADRFSPSKTFLLSAIAAAAFNLSVIWLADGAASLLILRFLTGFFLAGIYPVGMKIAADWFEKGLGKALGYLVGALVLGTAFPHLLKATASTLPWGDVLLATSILAVVGGLLLYLAVGDGPHRRPAPKFAWGAIPMIFKFKKFRSAAFGYFGHMWELYALWAFIPFLLLAYQNQCGQGFPIALWSFFAIAAGSLGCIAGGYISLKTGSKKVAFFMLVASGCCCLASPLLFYLPKEIFLIGMLIWGFSVVGDSPQFSTLVAQTAPREYIGTALTIVNCIGFALTIVSIQLLSFLGNHLPVEWLFLFLLPGPVVGLVGLKGD